MSYSHYHAMVGKTMKSVINVDNEQLIFIDEQGSRYVFYHDQDGREVVEITDIIGDLSDLEGSAILMAEEVSNVSDPDLTTPPVDSSVDSYTWTFYRFATQKGYVTVRWLGQSNGYYSEAVDFKIERPAEPSNVPLTQEAVCRP